MFKKVLALLLVLATVASMCVVFTSCGNDDGNGDTTTVAGGKTAEGASIKVGVILVGDETEGYSKSHMDGIEAAAAALAAKGQTVEYVYKKMVPESDAVVTNANDLIADGCCAIITNSYGHQFNFGDVITNNPDVTFVSMTGDLAASTPETNDYNAFTGIYEARYVSGVVAGLKLQELVNSGKLTPEVAPNAFDANGNIKIGYVGAFAYAEVVSGYTAFYLGVKSVVSNVVMTVKYTNSWFSEEREAAVAEYLLGEGCVIIGQHADSTGAPAAIENAYKKGNTLAFSVGYNVSMLDVAPDVALTSPTNVWEVFYEDLFSALLNNTEVPTEWAKGYSVGGVKITDLGTACAEGTDAVVADTIEKIKSGEIKVFNCANFTVGGQNITSYDKSYGFEGNECVKTENGVTFFDESTLRSAPYFDIRIDGITEVASDYAE